MLILLSPAKSLDYDTPLQDQPHSAPLFVKQSKALIVVLRDYAPPQISELMSLSDNLAQLNVGRYQAWSSRATPKSSRLPRYRPYPSPRSAQRFSAFPSGVSRRLRPIPAIWSPCCIF